LFDEPPRGAYRRTLAPPSFCTSFRRGVQERFGCLFQSNAVQYIVDCVGRWTVVFDAVCNTRAVEPGLNLDSRLPTENTGDVIPPEVHGR
jgi:hypothetical protein